MNSNNNGWALIYTIIFCVIIQSVALFTTTLITHNIKSGNTFKTLLSRRHIPANTKEEPTTRSFLLDAPEGWDHACFLTEVTERQWAHEDTYSWRIKMRRQPYTAPENQMLSSWRPNIIFLIDDSDNMLASCGNEYNLSRLYLKRAGGDIIPAEERDDVKNTLSTDDGIYFRGSYGNAWYQASNMLHFGGFMQCWTFAMSELSGLIDDMDMCPIAVATVSKGTIQPFTGDRKILMDTIKGIVPNTNETKLSEACFNLIGKFPGTCATSKHIVIATTGIPVNDGNIPAEYQDYDHDGNFMDKAIQETGSHCLDDVAAYARSKGITVHTIGPNSDFLKEVANDGGGAYLPKKGAFTPPASFVSQVHSLSGATRLFLSNTDLAFGPNWLKTDAAICKQQMSNDQTRLADLSSFKLNGVAYSLYGEGPELICSTSRGDILSIDTATKACTWMIKGAGGRILKTNNMTVTGPNIHGTISIMNSKPQISWVSKGEHFTVSKQYVYISDGKTVTSYLLDSGIFKSQTVLDSPVSVLEYDPCAGLVFAGTQSGSLYILDQGLQYKDLLSPDLQGDFLAIRSFHLKKELRIIALSQTRAMCATLDETLWETDLDGGLCTNAVVMDSKLYVTTWSPDKCYGIDSGNSSLLILDTQTGEVLSNTSLISAKAFGPLIDMGSGTVEHTGWNLNSHKIDITKLAGVKPSKLGSKINY